MAMWINIGRIDDQVKIRGFRIECGEIETQISKIEKIKMSVVMPKDDEHGNKRLVAYVVGDEKLDAQKIKKELEMTLTDYMIPSIISQIPVMPLTPNGFEDPTIAALAEHISNASDKKAFDIIVPLQENGKNRPIFMVLGIRGNVLGFYDFVVSLGKDQPVFGMQSIGIDGKEEPLKTIEEIAAANIKAIKDYQQTGPYRLVGHSFGGHVAYEMARQLTGSWEKLDYLILLDVFPYFESGMKNIEEIDLVFGICKLSAESYNINVTVIKILFKNLISMIVWFIYKINLL